jgi:short-subunit dehydrogenase
MTAPTYSAIVFGATSAIATEILRALVTEKPGAHLLLLGRNGAHLESVATDLRARGAECTARTIDLLDPDTDWNSILSYRAWDLFLIAHGSLPDQASTVSDPHATGREIDINFISPVRISSACAERIEAQGKGTLAVIGSVAGDRGRQSNYLYGSCKSALETFTEGLRHRLAKTPGASVVLLKPGMTDTPMTADITKGPLFTSAEKVGNLGWKAISKGKAVAYLPGWWGIIMLLIRSLPRPLLHRTKL